MKNYLLLAASILVLSSQSLYSQTLISENRPISASSELGANTAAKANDGLTTSRWESKHGTGISDTQWIVIDLGSSRTVDLVTILWENAYSVDYEIQVSDDQTFSSCSLIGKVVKGNGGTDSIFTDNTVSGRYVRIYMTKKATNYGHSIFELKLFDLDANQPVGATLNIPYAQFLRISISPPLPGGMNLIQLQNRALDTTLTFMQGVAETLTVVEKRGERDLQLYTVKKDTVYGKLNGALVTSVFSGMKINAQWISPPDTGNKSPTADPGPGRSVNFSKLPFVLDGSKSTDIDGHIVSFKWEQVSGPQSVTINKADSSIATVASATPGDYRFKLTVTDDKGAKHDATVCITIVLDKTDFKVISPVNDTVVTSSEGLVLSWQAVPGATRYEVWMNITKDNYDWYGSGNLLDQFTKIGESTTNSFTVTMKLQERWTYRWYTTGYTESNTQVFSDKGTFSLYHPVLETIDDGVSIVNGCRDINKNGTVEPYEDWHLPVAKRIDDLIARMSLQQKARQFFYGGDDAPEDGFCFSYGTEGDMLSKQKAASKTAMGIPVAFTGDKINGWKNIFPTELGLAATRDPSIAFACGNVQRKEHRFFGFTGTLSPLAEVDTKVLYPRFQEGWGENASVAAAMLKAMIVGMQGGPELNPHSMLITVKHWPSQGAGGESALQYDAQTIGYHMKPWIAAVEANAPSVMPGYNTCPFLDPDNGANSSLKVTAYLRNTIGFKGFVVTDWLAANTDQSIESMGAGIDVMGGAPSASTDITALANAIGMDRIDESCRRILDFKFRMGMFDNPFGDATCAWTHAEHHAVCLNAAKKSITLLENNGILPLKVSANDIVIVSGHRAVWPNKDNNPMAVWQSIYYDDPDAKTFLDAIKARSVTAGNTVQFVDTNDVAAYQKNGNVKAAVVVIGEKSYTHGTDWPDKNPVIPENQKAVIDKFSSMGIPVIAVIVSARPYVLTDIKGKVSAMMLVYRGGTAMPEAVAGLVFGDFKPSGKLPFQEPASISQIGTDNVNDQVEHWELPYDIGATDAQRATIKAAMAANTEVPDNFGDPLYPYGYGFDGFDNKSSVIRTIPSIKNRITIDVLHHTIRIQNVSGKIESVKVYNLNGKLVINRKTVPAPEIRIDIDNKIAQGSYIVEVSGVEKRVLEMRSVFIVK
jgi:beta-glucosidase-like glycosyl hydrolase